MSTGAGASRRVTRPRGEARGKVSTTPCHRQTDDTSTGLHAEDPAVIITHANTHIIMRTHTNTHTHAHPHTVNQQSEKGGWPPESPPECVFLVCLFLVLHQPWCRLSVSDLNGHSTASRMKCTLNKCQCKDNKYTISVYITT